MENKHFERELPEGYKEDLVIDAKSKKTMVILNICAILMMLIMMAVFFILAKNKGLLAEKRSYVLPIIIYVVCYFAYAVLHELTHGVVYKFFTREKLTFGFSGTVAFCGVPTLYIRKTAALCAVLAPFIVFTVAYGIPLLIVDDPIVFLVIGWLFAAHFSGCVGDLYGTWLLLFRYKKDKGKAVLMNDTGPKQTYYLPGLPESGKEE